MQEKKVRTRTLAIIKPDAFGHAAEIEHIIEAHGFIVVTKKTLRLTKDKAGEFYAVHWGLPFFDQLTSFMSSGPAVVMVLEHEEHEAYKLWRQIIGATNPRKADPDTIRAIFSKQTGEIYNENCVHGSDSPETAAKEINYFFPHLKA